MSKMSQLQSEILDMYYSEYSLEEICHKLNVDRSIVEQVVSSDDDYAYYDEDDYLDGDFDSAMSSAGFGTNEDYGYYGDD